MSDQGEIDREEMAVRYDCSVEDTARCLKCRRVSNVSECNNLQCPFCGGNMQDEPYVGWPAFETENNSLLQDLLASYYNTLMTVRLVDHLHPRSPLLPRRPYEWR